MRITSEVMVNRSLERLRSRLETYDRAQTQLATGRRINAPSEDPVGSRRVLSLQGSLRSRESEMRNADDARGWLDAADSQLQSAVERLGRVRDLATRGANLLAADEGPALAVEIRAIIGELEGIANTKHLGRPLFGGFGGGDAVTRAPDGTFEAHGTGDEVMRRVADRESVRINVTAGEWLGFASADGDVLSQLSALADALEANDSTAVGTFLAPVERATSRVLDGLAQIGAASNRVESARSRAVDLTMTLKSELSAVQDLDIAEGIMELQIQQVAYEATLQALGKALPPSLVAFLR
ncbi:hypothetical protein FTX61_18350 [Nitriliruptoraceae bacterium ZYF776]|nr:hypothetical protein [Profundirhabdus halotolerans]